ncbi:UDP-Glycosyltransferase/glycogen phosphorylase [Aureobasidium sp. EXF-10727]|nr:UDP-Glycosyltransferase/glycogen phosphorylase [Aureobasidium sp. EXF-10727]
MPGLALLISLAAVTVGLSYLLLPYLVRFITQNIGSTVRARTQTRRELLLKRAADDDKSALSTSNKDRLAKGIYHGKPAHEWEGIIGFFHPFWYFCANTVPNAGGGGERVLWAAIRATQERYPKALCIVYTGDHDVDKDTIIANVKNRFNIPLHAPRLTFLYLSTRDFLLAQHWPHFTLLGQSIGSLIVGWDAFNLVVPDIFIDTMGYAFTVALSHFLFPDVPTAAYVHYPTISTDMLGSLDASGRGVNAGSGSGWKGKAKKTYWHLFARLYSWIGGEIDVVMTNSTWTQNHIKALWGRTRQKRRWTRDTYVVFPPVAVEELEHEIEVSQESEKSRRKDILYIAQFRPEKDHQNIIMAFAEFLRRRKTDDKDTPRLVLVGSVRDEKDKMLVYKLRVLAREQHIADHVDFVIDAKWSQILDRLRTSWIGVNGMWNEHFGIGVVEYQAAGLISVVDDSGGPKYDIVVPIDGKPTGFHAKSPTEFADGFAKALDQSPSETLAMRKRARTSAKRFSEEVFRDSWNAQMDRLIHLRITPKGERQKLRLE